MNEQLVREEIFTQQPGENAAGPGGGPSLGLLLRKAREMRGLSVDDVVQSLKLSRRQIEAIEADRIDLLPGAVFQRGFVKSYARFLKLDSDEMLGLIEATAMVAGPEIRAPDNMGVATVRNGFRRIPGLVVVSIVLLLIAGGMAAWHFLGGRLLELLAVSGNPTVAHSSVSEPAPGISGVMAPDIAPPESTEISVVAPQLDSVSSSDARATEVLAVPAAVVAPVDSAKSVIDSTKRKLMFEFRGSSWIEVKDASGAVILTGVYDSGVQSVLGAAPIEIVIGNAAMVALSDNGQRVDLVPHTRAEVARLTLK